MCKLLEWNDCLTDIRSLTHPTPVPSDRHLEQLDLDRCRPRQRSLPATLKIYRRFIGYASSKSENDTSLTNQRTRDRPDDGASANTCSATHRRPCFMNLRGEGDHQKQKIERDTWMSSICLRIAHAEHRFISLTTTSAASAPLYTPLRNGRLDISLEITP